MSEVDIREYLDNKSVPYKANGSELVIKCPHCGKEKLSINEQTGKFRCFVCQAKYTDSPYTTGHISHLMELWGDVVPIKSASDRIDPEVKKNQQEVNFTDMVSRYSYDLMKSPKTLRYLLKRGITEESAKEFSLGFTRRYGQNWLVIPSFEDGIPKLLKLRKLDPDERTDMPKYIREKDSKSILFNGDALKKYDKVLMCEGEIDCITLLQQGFSNAVGITGGAGTLLPEWYDSLLMMDSLYLIFDSDKAGQNSARDVWAERLGISKCWNVELPVGMDINKFFLTHTRKDFEEYLKKAYQFKVSGVVSLKEALYEMHRQAQDEVEIQKFPLPWKSVNYRIGGGLQKKHLIVLGGIPGVGKTSFGLQICHYFAKQYKMPSLFFCLEMPETSLATKIVQLEYDITIDEINPSDGIVYADGMQDLPMYFGYSSKITPDVFYNTMREARNRYGIQVGVFDNLQRMVRSGEESDTGKASGIMKDIAMDLNITMILVSQPRKMNREEDPTYDDLKGSSAIPADSDLTILLHRKRISDGSSSLDPITRVIVDKSRFAPGGRAFLRMEGAKSAFVEAKADEEQKKEKRDD